MDLDERTPELRPLRDKMVALFGLGCIGAPSALELARAGIGELRILDDDIVDPSTIRRWPIGLSAAGLPKALVLRDLIARDYPYTRVVPVISRLGAVRLGPFEGMPEEEILDKMIAGASLIYDATAETGVQQFLSERAWTSKLPYIFVDGTQGGWGGRVGRFDPASPAGCWFCYQQALLDEKLPPPPFDPQGTVQPAGCGDPTFTGAGFDMASLALAGVRMAVSALCEGESNAYPYADWDAMMIAFRDGNGTLIPPSFTAHKVPRYPKCPRCGKH
jgi:molybdopterin/thiamine biosynthesis adenylyltransferase